jgi:ATP/maltotriose-dependent transcriptional regulator MalT
MHTSTDDPRCRAIHAEYLALARELNDEGSIAFGLGWAGAGDNYAEGNYRLARSQLEEGIAVADRLQSTEYVIAARFHLAFVLLQQGELGRARQVAAQAVKLGREMGERRFLAIALMSQALVAHTQGEVQAAVPWAEEAVTLGREVAARGDKWALAWALIAHGRTLSSVDPIRARASLKESVALNRALNIAPEAAWALFYLAWQALSERDSNALALAQEALALAEQCNMPHPIGWAHLVQGEWKRQSGEYEQAARLFDQAEQVFRTLGANGDLGILLHKRGLLAEAEEDPGRAASLWAQSLELARHADSWAIISANLRSLAGLALGLGRAEWAAQLIGAADALKVELIWSLRGESERYQQDRRAICELLGEKAFAANAAQGQRMQPEQVDALAHRIVRLASRAAPASPGLTVDALRRPASPLSPRELQVLDLVAQRLSDAEIGERLVISPRTVTTHLTSIYRKLGVGSRTEAVQAASALGLVDAAANT